MFSNPGAHCEGVHAAAVKEGIYARLLRAAQAASQLAPAQGQAFLQIDAICPTQNMLEDSLSHSLPLVIPAEFQLVI